MDKVASSRSRTTTATTRGSGGSTFDQYLADIKRLPLIGSVAEERALARLAQQGDAAAAERLVTANLRFVISYVKKYQGHGLDLAELVAIGNEGLLKAVRKFDPDQGVKFISYAVWWVRQAVLKALAEQTRSIRVPLNQNSALLRMAKAEQILATKLKREPTDVELGQMINEDAETVRAQRQMTTSETSLDAPVDKSDRDASTLGERFSVSDGRDIEEATDERLMRMFVKEAIQKHLTVRERQILTMYYGLDDTAEPMTLERIGDLLGVTRERIRQIRERAFEKLRESADGNALAGFWQVA
jgi:RNA polymerase primary sigma factor